MKKAKSSGGFVQIILILVVVVLIGGAYYFGKMSNKSTITVNVPTEEPVAVETQKPTNPLVKPTSDPTAGWKVYTSSTYSFKYPNEAKLEVQQGGVTKIMFMGQKQIDSGRTQTSLFDGYGFFVASQKDDSTLLQAYEKRVESFNNVCDPNKMGKLENSIVNGYEALKYEASCLGDYTTYLVKNGGSLYEINELYVGDQLDQVNYKKIADQILSTFKFTK